MINLFFGFILTSGILAAGVIHSGTSVSLFINVEGIIIVLCGTVAIFITANHPRVMRSLFYLIWQQLTGHGKKDFSKIRESIIQVSHQLENKSIPSQTGNELLDKGLSWLQAGLDEKRIDHLIGEFAGSKLFHLDEASNALMNLGKYPPALGMIGTVFGIIGIFSQLGNANSIGLIGPNLGIAMTATLYGLVMSNFFIQPLGEMLAQSVDLESRKLKMSAEAIKLWSQKETTFYIKEQMELYERAA